jgi:hypothetical protein
MLDLVHQRQKNSIDEEKALVREVIRKHSNSLYFLSDDAMYHTRVVNEHTSWLDNVRGRSAFLCNLRRMSPPWGHTAREFRRPFFIARAPLRVYSCRNEVFATLNKELSLVSICWKDITLSDYLTLLVH